MKISVEVTDERITDLLHGHGGSCSQWLHEFSGDWKTGKCRAKFDCENDNEGDGTGRMTFNRAKIQKGLSLMAQHNPYQWSEFLQQNDDDITFDVALQFIIFGKEIYG